jgi:hypothetical protein
VIWWSCAWKGGSTNALFTVVGAVCVVWWVEFLALLVVYLVVFDVWGVSSILSGIGDWIIYGLGLDLMLGDGI